MFTTITARRPGICNRCNGPIQIGDRMRYGGPRNCYHLAAECPASSQTADATTTSTPAPPRLSLTCPTCQTPNALTPAEARKGYQCRHCTAAEEGPGAPTVFYAPAE